MSVNEENQNSEKIMSTELGVIEIEKNSRKAKLKEIGKKGLKIAGVVGVGILGFLLGAKTCKANDCDEPEVIEVDDTDYNVE